MLQALVDKRSKTDPIGIDQVTESGQYPREVAGAAILYRYTELEISWLAVAFKSRQGNRTEMISIHISDSGSLILRLEEPLLREPLESTLLF